MNLDRLNREDMQRIIRALPALRPPQVSRRTRDELAGVLEGTLNGPESAVSNQLRYEIEALVTEKDRARREARGNRPTLTGPRRRAK